MVGIDTIKAFVYSIELRDIYTKGHSERVAIYAREFSKFLGLDAEAVNKVYLAGLLHDLGKIGIPDAILLKPGKLERDEFEIVKLHSTLSANIVSKVDGFADLAQIIKYHHEHFDGNGYPDGLKGKKIPLLSRILTIVDVFDALTTKRVYRAALNKQEALKIMEKIKNQFDPNLYSKFKVFLNNFEILKVNEFKLEKNVEELIENNVYFIDLNFKTLNREGLIAILKKSADLGYFGSLIKVDIKNFREYNRKYGSKQGDELLRKIISQIKLDFKTQTSLVTPRDGISYLARINADNFYILSIGSKGDFFEYKLNEFIKKFGNITLKYNFVIKNEKLKKYRNNIDYLI